DEPVPPQPQHPAARVAQANKGVRNRFPRSETTPKGHAEQPPAADALQPPLRCGFQARLRPGVRRQRRGEKNEGKTPEPGRRILMPRRNWQDEGQVSIRVWCSPTSGGGG